MLKKATPYFLIFPILAFISCSQSVNDEEFKRIFGEKNQIRLQFRKAFRDFGDSCQIHYTFTGRVIETLSADSLLDSYFEPQYLAYHDSLRQSLRQKQQYFRLQWQKMKPVVKQWEAIDMRFDRLVTKIKNGQLTERKGLDSLSLEAEKMKTIFVQIDSLQNQNRRNYWDFRNNHQEYLYNLNNLKALYAKKIYSEKK